MYRSCSEAENFKRATLCPQLPSRVIDVGDTGKDLHLFVTNRKHAAYATLSYCWGNANTFTTVVANLAPNQETIPLQLLPATLRDAVHFTRQLRIKYIWIDVLCIVQGYFDDRATESQKMAEVYNNAVVCFSGTGAEDASKGLFCQRRPLRLPQVALSTTGSETNINGTDIPLEPYKVNVVICQSFQERSYNQDR